MRTGWECTREGLRHGETLISFQRFPKPAGFFDAASVRSFGALRPEPAGDDILLPLPDDEAFWIGALLSRAVADGFALHGSLRDGRRIAPSSAWHGPLLTIMGFMDAGMFQPMTRPPLCAIDILVGADAIAVTVAAPDEFARLTGRDVPEPLQNDGAYKGWRLP